MLSCMSASDPAATHLTSIVGGTLITRETLNTVNQHLDALRGRTVIYDCIAVFA